jgi:hypothetical protein
LPRDDQRFSGKADLLSPTDEFPGNADVHQDHIDAGVFQGLQRLGRRGAFSRQLEIRFGSQKLRTPFPRVEFIAAGGVNQQRAGDYLAAGAAAVGIGTDLIPPRAIAIREAHWIEELARRYLRTVKYPRDSA